MVGSSQGAAKLIEVTERARDEIFFISQQLNEAKGSVVSPYITVPDASYGRDTAQSLLELFVPNKYETFITNYR